MVLHPLALLLAASPSPSLDTARADFAAQRDEFRRVHSATVRDHLHAAESILRERDVSSWSLDRRRRRELSLNALRSYWQEGDFPWDDDQLFDAPIFVDDDGTHCAVAEILRFNGKTELVDTVREIQNLGFVSDLAAIDGVMTGIEESGLDAEEAAFVQPRYGYCVSFADRFCMGTGRGWTDPSLVRARVVETTESGYVARHEETLWGPGDAISTDLTLVDDARRFFLDLSIDDELLVTLSEQSNVISVIRQNGERLELVDEPCAEDLSMDAAAGIRLLNRDFEGCVDAIEREHPSWARGFCVTGFSDPRIACPDASGSPDYELGEDGPPVAPESPSESEDSSNDGSMRSESDGGCTSIPPSTGLALWLVGALVLARRRLHH
jgi:hypothetical protein